MSINVGLVAMIFCSMALYFRNKSDRVSISLDLSDSKWSDHSLNPFFLRFMAYCITVSNSPVSDSRCALSRMLPHVLSVTPSYDSISVPSR